jgi:hypothetical protein
LLRRRRRRRRSSKYETDLELISEHKVWAKMVPN